MIYENRAYMAFKCLHQIYWFDSIIRIVLLAENQPWLKLALHMVGHGWVTQPTIPRSFPNMAGVPIFQRLPISANDIATGKGLHKGNRCFWKNMLYLRWWGLVRPVDIYYWHSSWAFCTYEYFRDLREYAFHFPVNIYGTQLRETKVQPCAQTGDVNPLAHLDSSSWKVA